MKAIAIIAIAAASMTVASPAFAKPQGTFGRATVSFNQKTNTYCFKEAREDSHIPHTECRTKEEWADAGLTITRKPAVQLVQR
ncbi:hypothetical protein C1T17_01235 [Sphingobium sp. SCG-1]|uniref:hypothetical protein n=1 Tax=Sphingobium sp. SCG-1 TaxID=2072936 RepID=UPI000CD6B8A3|nr:hypothetical protein [Sphingobium sp. SCG-1]AUW56897.1 hypothetical protein C1T17_01235 [Sphingobium sp. SCG-1]